MSKFQLTRLRGARPRDQWDCCREGLFQLTRLRGARRWAAIPGDAGRGFNSRACVGRDPPQVRAVHVCLGFNSRACVGRDDLNEALAKNRGSFNSRACVGRDRVIHLLNVIRSVSTHAPAWGATGLMK